MSVFYWLFTCLFLAADQLSKWMALQNLKGRLPVPVWNGIIHFTYVENTGAAFGMFDGLRWLFIPFAAVIVIWCFLAGRRLPPSRRYLPLRLILCMLSAGALGNMADRLLRGYVIDFIWFVPINFPVFNVADIYVCLSLGIGVILLFTLYRSEEIL